MLVRKSLHTSMFLSRSESTLLSRETALHPFGRREAEEGEETRRRMHQRSEVSSSNTAELRREVLRPVPEGRAWGCRRR